MTISPNLLLHSISICWFLKVVLYWDTDRRSNPFKEVSDLIWIITCSSLILVFGVLHLGNEDGVWHHIRTILMKHLLEVSPCISSFDLHPLFSFKTTTTTKVLYSVKNSIGLSSLQTSYWHAVQPLVSLSSLCGLVSASIQ